MLITHVLMEKLNFLANLAAEWKRYTSLALAAGISMLGFYLSTVLSYIPAPTTLQSWAEALFGIAFLAVVGSQSIHARTKLRTR
jgi:biotin transporter BioY